MEFGRRLRTPIGASLIAAGAIVLGGCSTVTYGTGVPTTTQTIQDILPTFNSNEQIAYVERPGLQTPQTNALPPPVEGGTAPAATPPPTTTAVATNCNIGPQQTTPPPGYCTPDPAAPVTGTNQTAGVRALANPCDWWAMTWNEIGPDEREEWAKLGWDGTNWRSNNAELWPNSAGKVWADLRLRERRGAEALGFTQVTWDACYLV